MDMDQMAADQVVDYIHQNCVGYMLLIVYPQAFDHSIEQLLIILHVDPIRCLSLGASASAIQFDKA
jgi:hypothetical protein